MTSKWLEGSKKFNFMWKKLMKLHHFALNVHADRTKVSMRKTEECSNHESPPEQRKSHLVGRNPAGTRSLGFKYENDRLVL